MQSLTSCILCAWLIDVHDMTADDPGMVKGLRWPSVCLEMGVVCCECLLTECTYMTGVISLDWIDFISMQYVFILHGD